MEILQGLFFNAIWIVGGLVTSLALTWIFKFVSLPLWLEFGIIFALSILSGLMWMFVFCSKSMGKSWRQCWMELRDIILPLAVPVVAACIVAVIAQLILNPHIKDEELQQWVVWPIAGVFWCLAMSAVTKHFQGKLKN